MVDKVKQIVLVESMGGTNVNHPVNKMLKGYILVSNVFFFTTKLPLSIKLNSWLAFIC